MQATNVGGKNTLINSCQGKNISIYEVKRLKEKKKTLTISHAAVSHTPWGKWGYFYMFYAILPPPHLPPIQTARHIIIQTKLFCDASDFTHAQRTFLQGAFKPVSPFLMLPRQHFSQSGARCLWRNSCCHYFLMSGRRRWRRHVFCRVKYASLNRKLTVAREQRRVCFCFYSCFAESTIQ